MIITQNQFTSFKEDAIRNQPLRNEVPLNEIRFVTMDSIEYAGLNFGLARPALKDLMKILGFSMSTEQRLSESIGEEGARNFLNSLKTALSRSGGAIVLFVTPDRVIQRISRGGKETSLFSAPTFFDTVDRFINSNTGMEIKHMHFNRETGGISLSASSPQAEFGIGNFADEVFHGGLNLSITADGISAAPYLDRLVCTNGMVTRSFEESFNLNRNTQESWTSFWQNLERIERGGFKPVAFQSKVLEAKGTIASLSEVERSMNLILSNSKCDRDNLPQFINYKPTYNRLHTAGIDTLALSYDQKRNLRTGLTVWDCINGITDFASHNYGFEKTQNCDRHLQLQAGDILTKSFDTKNLILHQPY
jgi:hypothetical protein